MAKSTISIPEIETLDYHSPLCKCSECEKNPVHKPEQPDYSKCRHCGACRAGRPTGEWQFACKCNEDDKIYPPEQPKDNPGPLENLIVNRIGHDLENIAANLEMLKSSTKEQKQAKCVLTLEIAHITGEGGMFDDLKEAFE